MATIVTGELYEEVQRKMHEIQRQIHQPKGYAHDPHELKAALQRAIDGRFFLRGFETWGSLGLGMGVTSPRELRNAMFRCAYEISREANGMLESKDFKIAEKFTKIDLINVSAEELGLKSSAKTREIYARAFEFGLELCPSEAGPQLMLQYMNQPKGELVGIAMKPVVYIDTPLLFSVERTNNGERWLRAAFGDPNTGWSPGRRWIFQRPNKQFEV